MGLRKLQGPCIVCKTVVDMQYHSVTKVGLNKALGGELYLTKIPNLKLDDILCHNCYMEIIEWDRYKKQKPKVRKPSDYDSTYQLSNKKRVTITQKNFESLFEKAKIVEEFTCY